MRRGVKLDPLVALVSMRTPNRRELRAWTAPLAATPRDHARRRATIDAIASQAEALNDVYETECFVASLLGQMWERRARAPKLEGVEPDVVLYDRLVQDLAEHSGSGARLVVRGVGRLLGGGMGIRCDALLDGDAVAPPQWAAEIGRSRVIAASVQRSPGAGEAILLEVRGAGMVDHAVAVFIDERLGGIAKHLGLVQPEAQRPADLARLSTRSTDPRAACARVREAIVRTDAQPGAPVGERFAELRAIAVARVRSVASGAADTPCLN